MPGAILASVLWALVSNLFRLYVYYFGKFNITYGTIGAFIVLLLWLQISSLIMLLGAQLNVIVGDEMRMKI
jgi:membrane protein